MKFNVLKILNGSVILILFLLNLFIFINRDNDYAFKDFLTYEQLYPFEGDLKIKKVNFNKKDSLTIELIGSTTHLIKYFKILLPDSTLYTCQSNPKIILKEGIHSYAVLNDKSDTLLEVTLNFIKESTYMKNDRKRDSDVEFMYCSIPFETNQNLDKEFWKQTSQFTTNKELNLAKEIIKDSMKILQSDQTIIKVQKISSFIINKLDSKRGIPKDTMEFISPWKRFEFAIHDKSKIWCGDFSSIFAFFSEAAGIITRSIWIEGNGNGIKMAGHSFNEVYIDDLQKWIFIDLTSKTIGIQSNEGEYLNTIEFYNAFLLKSKNIQLTTIKNNNISIDSIDYSQSFYQHYFNGYINFRFYYASQFSKNLYNFKEKTLRYLSEKPNYGIYSNTIPLNNSKFYTKKYAFWGLIFFSIYYLSIRIINLFNKKSKNI